MARRRKRMSEDEALAWGRQFQFGLAKERAKNRRKRRKNPGSYWTNFGLAAAALVAVLYVAKRNPKLFGG